MRTILAALLVLCLSGCWLSEEDLFGATDLAKVDIEGEYRVKLPGSDEVQQFVTATPQSDGSIEMKISKPETRTEESVRLGFVPIEGGSGQYYLALDMTRREPGQIYLLVHYSDLGVISFYAPECAGTPDLSGMERQDGFGSSICKFTSKAALMAAAREAAAFLSRPQIVTIQPIQRMEPWNDAAEAAERAAEEAMGEFELKVD